MLDHADKAALLGLARRTLEAHLAGEGAPGLDRPGPALLDRKGAFVSLHREGDLRGCIGQIIADRPLCEIVARCAVSAACGDPRFPPVTAGELPLLELEISVLAPLRRIDDVEEIRVGVHGLYLVSGPHRGLLLPQVASEQGWDRRRFLEHTCRKAGAAPTAWREAETEIYVFEAEVFSESGLSRAAARS
jgi:AmmeMemoRadiSam system protein A